VEALHGAVEERDPAVAIAGDHAVLEVVEQRREASPVGLATTVAGGPREVRPQVLRRDLEDPAHQGIGRRAVAPQREHHRDHLAVRRHRHGRDAVEAEVERGAGASEAPTAVAAQGGHHACAPQRHHLADHAGRPRGRVDVLAQARQPRLAIEARSALELGAPWGRRSQLSA
jgi:hypothetical protein